MAKNRINVSEVVDKAYREIIQKGKYNVTLGNKPINKDLLMKDIPQIMTDYIDSCGYGCCFVFSAYMIQKLQENGIKCFMVATKEDSGTRASVLYIDNGHFYIANPVEDIEYFTRNNIPKEERLNYYFGSTSSFTDGLEYHDNSRFTIDEFGEKYGQVWLIGDMSEQNQTQTLEEAMTQNAETIIYPPEMRNEFLSTIPKK